MKYLIILAIIAHLPIWGSGQTLVSDTIYYDNGMKVVVKRNTATSNIPTSTRLIDTAINIRTWVGSNYSPSNHTHTGVYQPVGSYLTAADVASKIDKSDSATYQTKYRSDTSRSNVYAAIGGKQIAGSYVSQATTVNGHALSGNVSVTTTDLSLQNVNNTSDINKPVSTAQQTALDLKANLISPVFTTPNIGTATGSISGNAATVTTNANLTGDITSVGNATTIGATKVTNAMLAGSIAYSKLSLTGAVLNADLAGSIAYSKLSLAGSILNADLAGSIAASKLVGTDIATTGKLTNYNGIATVGNGVPSLVATIDLTAQVANIATATLYAVPASGAGMYRVNIYITVTSIGTTSTMPSTTITYTDGNAGTNSHSTTTTATNAGNSVTTTFAQTTYVLYAKASTNIQYATGGYASTGTAMQYAIRIKVEAL